MGRIEEMSTSIREQKLIDALRRISDMAPIIEPGNQSGTGNEDDAKDYGYALGVWDCAKVAREVIEDKYERPA
jgi:hypothetical protein